MSQTTNKTEQGFEEKIRLYMTNSILDAISRVIPDIEFRNDWNRYEDKYGFTQDRRVRELEFIQQAHNEAVLEEKIELTKYFEYIFENSDMCQLDKRMMRICFNNYRFSLTKGLSTKFKSKK